MDPIISRAQSGSTRISCEGRRQGQNLQKVLNLASSAGLVGLTVPSPLWSVRSGGRIKAGVLFPATRLVPE